MKKKVNKYLYVYVVQGLFSSSYGWEDLTESEDYKEAREDLKDYRDNDHDYSYRLVHRRVVNPNYVQ